ncbi:MAG TPA: hypothetical protein VE890_10400 [Thermoguttaceae bacterium]|nr:hypothetical protein [Thermoguttaceae bacterium]
MQTGCSVRDLLCGELGIAPEYVDTRIQTIFLNSRTVDDPQSAIVTPGSTIALSAAMPGVAGAMFRKGSPYAPMRSRISHADRADTKGAACESHVVLKLFNMVQRELGAVLLARGVQVSGRALADLFRGRSEAFRHGILTTHIDGTPVDPRVLIETDWSGRDVFLQIR